ncbi:Rz1-like lysis system protein LysC, partial [Shewanella baltica]
MKKRNLGALLISLQILIGCSSVQPDVRTVTVTKIKYVFPPQELISQCLAPRYSSKKNQELSEYTNSLIEVIS